MLFDLESDPEESRGLAGARPEMVRALADEVARFRRDIEK
jgi:hypothetical protein